MMAGEFVTLLDECLGRAARRRRSALRSAPFHGAGHRDPGRHGGEHPGAGSRSDLGISLPARPRSAEDHRHGSRRGRQPKSCPNISAARQKPAFDTGPACAAIPAWRWTRSPPPVLLARELTGANQVEAVCLWHRSRPFPELRHSGGDLRPRLHRAGASAR